MLVDYHIYIQFGATATNEQGRQFSFEPRKWLRLLDSNYRPDGIGYNIDAYGPSEYPTSLNLRMRLEPKEVLAVLDSITQEFPGAKNVNIFEPVPGLTPELKKVPAKVAQIEHFRQQRSA